jgi:hypothetical protein
MIAMLQDNISHSSNHYSSSHDNSEQAPQLRAHHCGVVPTGQHESMQQVRHRQHVPRVQIRSGADGGGSVAGYTHALREQAWVDVRVHQHL